MSISEFEGFLLITSYSLLNTYLYILHFILCNGYVFYNTFTNSKIDCVIRHLHYMKFASYVFEITSNKKFFVHLFKYIEEDMDIT